MIIFIHFILMTTDFTVNDWFGNLGQRKNKLKEKKGKITERKKKTFGILQFYVGYSGR